jgi:hypothetical protein
MLARLKLQIHMAAVMLATLLVKYVIHSLSIIPLLYFMHDAQ